MVHHIYRAEWSWPGFVESWVREQVQGTSLNFPCGNSKIGDIRADIDIRFHPDIICDLDHPPFQERSFDTLICDPPFAKYNKFKWLYRLMAVARKKILLSSPPCSIRLTPALWKKSWYIHETNVFFVRLWQIFERDSIQKELT